MNEREGSLAIYLSHWNVNTAYVELANLENTAALNEITKDHPKLKLYMMNTEILKYNDLPDLCVP